MRLILAPLRFAYYLLYHQLAWTYDLVAAVVSLGRWQRWVHCALPYLHGQVLEIGYGPGHLQVNLETAGVSAFGLDESRQMALQAGRRLHRQKLKPTLTRGLAQYLPFSSGSFDCVVATFPSEYIFEPQTLNEIHRALTSQGRLVILPMAWLIGGKAMERVMAWLLRLVGETPGHPGQVSAPVRDRLNRAGFLVESHLEQVDGSQVLVIVGTKTATV